MHVVFLFQLRENLMQIIHFFVHAVPVVFSEVQLTLSEDSTGSIDLLILPSSLGELQADAQVSVTTVLQQQDGATGEYLIIMYGFTCLT
jgi:hypothetical protein